MAKPGRKKVKMTRSQAKIFNKNHFGEEPVFGLTELTQMELIKAYNWYNYMLERKDATFFIKEYIKERDKELYKKFTSFLAKARANERRISSAICWTARLVDRGINVPEATVATIIPHVIAIIEKYSNTNDYEESDENSDSSNVVVLVDKSKERENFFIGDIEEMIDRGEIFSVYDYLTANNVPKVYANKIIAYYTPILAEIESAFDEVFEGYHTYKKRELKQLKELYEKIIAEANRYADNKTVARKPRKKKIISIDKKLKYVQYMPRFDEMQLISKDPSTIIGAKEVWLFDAKYKGLIKLVSNSSQGFDIKGTTIVNIDMTNSRRKATGRKSAEYVNMLLTGGKIAVRKLMDTIKGDGIEPNGRINKNMLILKAT